MALFNPFKNKKQNERKDRKDPSVVREKKKDAETVETTKPQKSLGWSGGILLAPHTTEKSTAAAKRNQHMFRVSPDANKIMIADAVEKKYGVNVVRVNTMNVQGKRVRIGKREGRSPGFKKAMVTIQEGQAIEIQ